MNFSDAKVASNVVARKSWHYEWGMFKLGRINAGVYHKGTENRFSIVPYLYESVFIHDKTMSWEEASKKLFPMIECRFPSEHSSANCRDHFSARVYQAYASIQREYSFAYSVAHMYKGQVEIQKSLDDDISCSVDYVLKHGEKKFAVAIGVDSSTTDDFIKLRKGDKMRDYEARTSTPVECMMIGKVRRWSMFGDEIYDIPREDIMRVVYNHFGIGPSSPTAISEMNEYIKKNIMPRVG